MPPSLAHCAAHAGPIILCRRHAWLFALTGHIRGFQCSVIFPARCEGDSKVSKGLLCQFPTDREIGALTGGGGDDQRNLPATIFACGGIGGHRSASRLRKENCPSASARDKLPSMTCRPGRNIWKR